MQQAKPTTSYEHWREHAKRQMAYKKNISMAPTSANVSAHNHLQTGMAPTIPNSFSQVYHRSNPDQQRMKLNRGALPGKSEDPMQ